MKVRFFGVFIFLFVSTLAFAQSDKPDTRGGNENRYRGGRNATACGEGSAIGYCAVMHNPRMCLRGTDLSCHAINNSTNPDVSTAKFLKIEKDYASRGEPLNTESLAKMMAFFVRNPTTKCTFQDLGGGYGLSCTGGKGEGKFPGLTKKLLEQYFPKYDATPKVEEAPIVDKTAENQEEEPEEEATIASVEEPKKSEKVAPHPGMGKENTEINTTPASVTEPVDYTKRRPAAVR